MGILECASSASAWRGYEYFERNKVGIIQKCGDSVFRASVWQYDRFVNENLDWEE